jgi:hypothetical protein
MVHRAFPLAYFVLLGFAACSGSGADSSSLAAATIDPSGGVFEVTEGRLAGVKVEIPPGAIAQPVRVTADAAFSVAHPGFRAIGRAVRLGPDVAFLRPVIVTLPFPREALSSNEPVILQRTNSGTIVELPPTSIDPNGRATFHTLSLSTCWVGERLFLGVGTEEFLPFEDGNTWNFTNGLSATISMAIGEPNFGGFPVFRLQFDGPDHRLGFYVERHWSGATNVLGSYTTDGGGFQQRHDAARLLPAHCTLGQGMLDAFGFTTYAPYGSTRPVLTGVTVVHQLPSLPAPLMTAVREYEDLLRIDVELTQWSPAGQLEGSTTLGLVFARFVGLVRVEAFGLAGDLVSGTVGGAPIVP